MAEDRLRAVVAAGILPAEEDFGRLLRAIVQVQAHEHAEVAVVVHDDDARQRRPAGTAHASSLMPVQIVGPAGSFSRNPVAGGHVPRQ